MLFSLHALVLLPLLSWCGFLGAPMVKDEVKIEILRDFFYIGRPVMGKKKPDKDGTNLDTKTIVLGVLAAGVVAEVVAAVALQSRPHARDALLAACSLVLFLLQDKATEYMTKSARLEMNVIAMKKQALSASRAAERAMSEAGSKKGEADGDDGESSKESKAKSDAAKANDAAGDSAAKKAADEKIAAAEKKVAAVVAQAEGQQEQMLALMEQKRQLERKLEDYELVLGDQRKKAV